MDCPDALRMLDDADMDLALTGHLEQCPSCRQEAEFARRVAAAVAGLSQVRAPKGFVEGVMAAVRQRPVAVRQPRRSASLVLRPWELGWLALSSLALLILLSFELRGWLSSWGLTSPMDTLAGWASSLWTAAGGEARRRTWTHGLRWLWQIVGDYGNVGSRVSLVWLWGGAMFALALYLLLTWGRSDMTGAHREDVHVQAG